jgi:hypothetical protein
MNRCCVRSRYCNRRLLSYFGLCFDERVPPSVRCSVVQTYYDSALRVATKNLALQSAESHSPKAPTTTQAAAGAAPPSAAAPTSADPGTAAPGADSAYKVSMRPFVELRSVAHSLAPLLRDIEARSATASTTQRLRFAAAVAAAAAELPPQLGAGGAPLTPTATYNHKAYAELLSECHQSYVTHRYRMVYADLEKYLLSLTKTNPLPTLVCCSCLLPSLECCICSRVLLYAVACSHVRPARPALISLKCAIWRVNSSMNSSLPLRSAPASSSMRPLRSVPVSLLRFFRPFTHFLFLLCVVFLCAVSCCPVSVRCCTPLCGHSSFERQ